MAVTTVAKFLKVLDLLVVPIVTNFLIRLRLTLVVVITATKFLKFVDLLPLKISLEVVKIDFNNFSDGYSGSYNKPTL